MRTIKEYYQGERFVYGRKNCMVLEHMDDGTLCMVLDEDFESKFGETNNFAESELRKKLNGEYLDEWVKDGVDRASFVLMQVDLTANDGLKDYDACECFLAPRTCDQHRKYRYLIPNPKGNWEWTATAYSTKANGYSLTAYQVTSAGALDISYFGVVYSAYGVRPLFKLNPNTVIISDTISATISLKMDEPRKPIRAKPCEHEFEDLYNVWVERADGYKKKRLVFCKKCGQVFVKDLESNKGDN